jgi:protoporphyrin/coproporphyrin ferrochelatase
LFSDPAILVGIPTPFRQFFAFLIAQIKGPQSKKNYLTLGGGSPIHAWTQLQSEGLESRLSGGQFKVCVGMRIGTPTIWKALTELQAWGASQIIYLPLFPQFSTTTTLSCFKEADRMIKALKHSSHWAPKRLKINHFSNHPLYISLLRQTIEEALLRVGTDAYILFSAHSLPLSIVKRGDPYLKHVENTVHEVSTALALSASHPFSLAFQSRNGRLPWLEPYLEDELVRLSKKGIQKLIVVPISFVSDHIETLWELDLYYAEIAKRVGIQSFFRTRAFNDDPNFIDVLKSLCFEAIEESNIQEVSQKVSNDRRP